MSQTIKLKRTAVAGRIPALNVLELGEVAINTADGKMYIKKSVNGVESIVEIGGSGEGFTAFTTYTYTATANQTVFSGADANNNSLDIVDEFSNVFLNGILLDPDTDFTIAPGGFSVTLSVAAEAGDLLQVNTYDQAIFNGTLSVNALELDGSAGLITWNGTEETVDIPLNSDVTLQVGQEQVFRGKATEAISNGDVVMFAGAQGDHLLVAKADINSLGFRPEFVIGLATQDFAINDFGFVTSQGKVRGLDTANGWSEGDVIYLDPTTAGAWTTTVPTPPSHIIQVAAVTRSHGTEGTVLVRVTHFSDTDEVPEGSTNLYFTDARATAAIKADADWNASDWDTAYGWGDHSTENYLTTVDFNDLTSKPTTIAGYGITDAFDGAYGSLTGAPTNVSSFTNDSGYITDYSVTQGDVTAHQGALSITESQISDFGTYLTSETTTSLSASGNILTYTDEDGNSNTIDLSLYIDDTNAARITSGTMSGSGIATFTRDDSTTFTVDMSVLLDDTNLARITSAAWNTSNGVLTLTRNDASTITVDLDDRYLTSHQDISGKANLSGDTFTGPVTFTEQGSTFKIDPHAVGVDLYSSGNLAPHYQTTFTLYTGNIGTGSQRLNLDASGNLSVTGTLSASGYNKSNWDTAYGWGNHASAGYLTSLPSHNHNDLYYTETESDSRFVNVTGDTMTGSLNLSSNKLILIDGNHYLQYASTSHSGHTVDGPRLEGHQGGELSTNYTGIETALRWTHTNNVHLYGELKMGETTVIDGSKNLTNIGTISLAGSSNRPMFIGQAGSITTKGSSGGWSQGLLYYGSSNTYRGGFGALGTGDALDYFWIGSEYNDGSNFRFYPNGTFNIGGTTVIDSSRNATFASQLIVRGAGNSSKGNIHMGNAGNGTNKWSYLTGAHYNADTESEGFALIGGFSSSLDNRVVIGGSIYESNPCTSIEFWGHTATTHATGGSLRGAIDHDGFNVLTGGYRVNSTTVIDSSRNFSGNHGTFAGDVIVNNSNGYNYLRINKGTGGDGGVLFEVADSLKWQNVQRDDGGLQWYSYGRGATNVIFPSLGDIELHAGDYKIGDTTVINSGRELRSINGLELTNNYSEKVMQTPYFTNTVPNLACDVILGNDYINGVMEFEITGNYSSQNTTGTIRRKWYLGLNANNSIWQPPTIIDESVEGAIVSQIYVSDPFWDSGDSTYKIRIYHKVSTGNTYQCKIKLLGGNVGGKLLDNISMGSLVTASTASSHISGFNARSSYRLNGTTVIDASRNLTNIASLTLSGNNGSIKESTDTFNNLVIGSGNTALRFINNSGQRRIIPRDLDDTAENGTIDFGDSGSQFRDIYLSTGAIVNGQRVIDSSRNLTNIGNITATGQLNLNRGADDALFIDTTVADNTTRPAIKLYENDSQSTGRQSIQWFNGNLNYTKAEMWTQVGGSFNATRFGIDVANNARSVDTRLFIENGNTYITGVLAVGTGGNSSYIWMEDLDNGGRYIHCNSDRIGFLTSANAWGSWSNDDGSWQTAVAYGINGTTVIDSSRNATFAGLTISGNGSEINFTGSNNRIKFSGYRAMEGTTDGSGLFLGEQYVDVNCMSNLNLTSGHEYRVNGTTVIDSSRNFIGAKGTFTGTGIGGAPTLDIINSTAITFNHSAEIMTPNMTAGQHNIVVIGRESNTKNAGYIGYLYSGSAGDNANKITLGHWGNDDLVTIDGLGNTNINEGALQIGGTTVIDSSRNLNNIGAIQSGTIGSTATNNILKVMSTGDSQVIGLKASYLDHPTLAGYFRYSTGDAQLYIDNAFASNGGEAYSNINFRNGSSLVTRMQIKGNTGRVNVVNGLELNGTTVIDSNRSLTSIASLDITSATGNITFSNSGLTKRGIYGTMGDNDQWFIGGGATSSNVGYLEISTGDDGQNTSGGCEEILVRQYGPGDPLTGALHRTLKLLDNYGNTSIPANVTMANGNLDINTSVQNAIEIFESSGSSGYNYMRFLNTTGSTQYGSIYRSFSSMVYGTSSDYRLKENVVDLTNASDRINLIPVRRFNFIEHPDRTVDGFLAHEVQAVVPEAIIGEKDGVDDTGAPVYQGIDQSKLVPLLTAALQEALQEIENLKQETQSLIDRVTNLENN